MSYEEERLKQRSLLLVDNDERMMNQLKEIMEYQGFHIITANNGSSAIEKIEKGRYSCAILDYALPDMMGDKVARKIKKLRPEIGLILLTGFKDALNPKILDIFDYVFEKPADLEILINVLVKIDNAYRSTQSSKILATPVGRDDV